MTNLRLAVVLFLCSTPRIVASQSAVQHSSAPEPTLPVIDYKACPFEGCTFGKWIVTREDTLFSTWKEARKPVVVIKKGEVVTGLTGVHITLEPDRVEILQPIPELGVQPGDTILRYMYRGEGFADVWVKGQWKKEYDCTFISEKDSGGCLRNCAAKVVSNGRKDWWVQVKTAAGSVGWTKAEDQFDCMDALGGDEKCADLAVSEARSAAEANLRTPEGKAYDAKVAAEFGSKYSPAIQQCLKTGNPPEDSEIFVQLEADGRVADVMLAPQTKLGECLRDVLFRDTFSIPPGPKHWVRIQVKMAP